MKFRIFIHEGRFWNDEGKRQILIAALSAYCDSLGIEFDINSAQIKVSKNGKPYVKDMPIYFNISHSDELWMCIVGPGECGLDLQVLKDCNYKKIANRHFNRLEKEYVDIHGISGFFEIWVRREAYGKYTGEGFFGKKPSFVDGDLLLAQQVGDGFVKKIEISEDIFCAYCTGGQEDEIEFFG